MTRDSQSNGTSAFSSTANRADWASATQQRRRSYRRWISVAHHLTFFLGRKFPKAVPLIYVIGYPKSGTTWVCQLLSDYLQLPFPQHAILPVGCPAVVHGHETVRADYPQGIYVMRDGRDVAISAFHHLRKHSQLGGKSKGKTNFFAGRSGDQSVSELLPDFVEHMWKHPFGAKIDWGKHVQSCFHSTNHNFGVFRYEDLVDRPEHALTSMIENLTREQIDTTKLSSTCVRFTFEAISGRASGTENKESYLRKGTHGDWRNHFTLAAAQAFDQCFGEALISAGYESSRDWVVHCPQSISSNVAAAITDAVD
ncbi:MAG: sulfotransferase domain-containing protein [Pirellulales bacterium]